MYAIYNIEDDEYIAEIFRELNEAREYLLDLQKDRLYDWSSFKVYKVKLEPI